MGVIPKNFEEQDLSVSLPELKWDFMVLLKHILLELLEDRLLEKHFC